MPKLDPKEVAAVFSAPFYNFLLAEDEGKGGEGKGGAGGGGGGVSPPGKWYEGNWAYWHDTPWRMHFFYVPVTSQRVTKPSADGESVVSQKPDPLTNTAADAFKPPALPDGNKEANPEEEARKALKLHVAESAAHVGRYKVWGMTARILVDAAMIAYGQEPEFEHNSHFGDENLILALDKIGTFEEKKTPGGVLTGEDLRRAKKAAEGKGRI